jgi:AP-1 complex subunit beta-1
VNGFISFVWLVTASRTYSLFFNLKNCGIIAWVFQQPFITLLVLGLKCCNREMLLNCHYIKMVPFLFYGFKVSTRGCLKSVSSVKTSTVNCEMQASMIWIIGEYAERIDNADELLESFLETFPEEPAQVQLQLLTAAVKLFLKKPTEGPQQMIQVVLNNATQETDNPDLRDRAYVYWRLLSTDPEAAKDVVLAEKPTICDDSNMLDSSLLDELLANIATLASVYHKPPDAFVSRARPTPQQDEDEEYNEGQDMGPSESSAPVPEVAATPATTQVPVAPAAAVPRTAAAQVPPTQPVADLLGDLMGLETALVPVGPATSAAPAQPSLPVLLPATSGQGLQISGQLTRRDGHVFYSLKFDNLSQTFLDGFMIQFNKNTFGLAAAGPLQVGTRVLVCFSQFLSL